MPDKLKRIIEFSTLKLESESCVDKKYRHRFTDVLYSARFQKKPGYLYVLAEHQSSPDSLMPFRLMEYMCLIWRKHLKRQQSLPDQCRDKKLPIIYPLVFYHGKKTPYHYSMDFIDCFDDKQLAREVLHQPFQLIDVRQIPDEELFGHGLAATFELLQKHIYQRDIYVLIKRLLEKGELQKIRYELGGGYFFDIIQYIAGAGNLPKEEVDEFFSELAEHFPEERGDIMTIADILMERGMERGVEEGKRELIHMMLSKNHDIPNIAELTGLSEKAIVQLIETA